MTKEAIDKLANDLATLALSKRAGSFAPAPSGPMGTNFNIGLAIQRFKEWFSSRPPEVQKSIIYSLLGAGATGLVSAITGGNIPLDTLLGAGLGGLGGYAGSKAYQYFTQPEAFAQITPAQQRALHSAAEGPGILSRTAPSLGVAAGGAAAGGAARGTLGSALGRRSAVQGITGGAASDQQIAALWESVRRRPTASSLLKLRSAIAEREMANALRGQPVAERASQWMRNLRSKGIRGNLAQAGLGQQVSAGGPTMGLLDKLRLYVGDPTRASKLEQMVESRVARRLSGMAEGLPRAMSTAANVAQGTPGAVAGHAKLGPAFRDLFRGAWKKAPGRARLWLGLPALAAGGYSLYNQLANGQEQ